MFWPYDARPEDIVLDDIAVPLSRMCRYGGHCKEFYAVTDHSVWVMDRVPKQMGPAVQLAALLHDAAEGYMRDIPRPVKHSPQMDEYRRVEAFVQLAIYQAFGSAVMQAAEYYGATIKELDNLALATEKRDLVVEGRGRWKGVEGVLPDPDPIEHTVSMRASCAVFVHHVKRLYQETYGQPLGGGLL